MTEDPQAGDRWGRYLLGEAVEGGTGTFLATDIGQDAGEGTGADTAGDTAEATAGVGEVEVTVLRSEEVAATLADLDSPYLVPVIDVGRHEGTPYVVTERVRGVRLDRLLYERGVLEPKVAVAVAAQVAAGLRDAHRVGLHHGRLRAADVVLGMSPTDDPATSVPVRLTGFGRAEDAGVTDDVHAAGRVLEALLADAVTRDDDGRPRVSGTDRFSRGLSWVLARSTADDATKRHRDAAALRADLLTLLPAADRPPEPAPVDTALPVADAAGTSTPDRPEPGSEAPAPAAAGGATRPRRRAVLAGLVALVVLLGGAGIATAVVLGGDDTDGGDSPTATDDPAPPVAPDDGRVTGDVDGDGRGDVVQVFSEPGSPDRIFTNLSRGDGLRVRQVRPAPVGPTPLLADLDGDAVPELLAQAPAADVLELFEVDGQRTWTVTGTGLDQVTDAGGAVVGDYDGDGTDDVALLAGSEVRVAVGGDEELAAEPWAGDVDADELVAADLDGDRRDDVVAVRREDDGGVTLLPLLSDGTSLSAGGSPGRLADVGDAVLLGADTVGDDVDRVLAVPATGSAAVRAASYGDGSWSELELGRLAGVADEPVLSAGLTDLDGDGRDDLVVVRRPELALDVILGDGDALGPVEAFVELPFPDEDASAVLVGGAAVGGAAGG